MYITNQIYTLKEMQIVFPDLKKSVTPVSYNRRVLSVFLFATYS